MDELLNNEYIIQNIDSFNKKELKSFLLEKCRENIDYKDIKAVEIEFSVNTKYAPDVPLREDSYIKINSFYARIPEGISLDLGEQIPSKEETNE